MHGAGPYGGILTPPDLKFNRATKELLMGLFEFLMILISVVVGLALSEVLTGVANLLRVRETIRFHWIHALFQIGVFFALLQQWWESWDLVGVGSVSFGMVLALLFPPVMLFLIAHLLYPRPATDANLEDYYYRQAPVLWGLVILGTAVGTFTGPLLEQEPVFHVNNLSGFPLMAICIALIISKSRLVHSILVPPIVVLVILDTWIANPAISAN